MVEIFTKNNAIKSFNDYLGLVISYIEKNYNSKKIGSLEISKKLNSLFSTDLFSVFTKLDLENLSSVEFDQISLFDLALIYENLFTDNNRHGRFFTPIDVAHEICEKAVASFKLNQSVIDPACGTGVFPLKFIDRVTKKFNLSDDELITYVEENLFFADLDLKALTLARVFISLKTYPDLLNINIKNPLEKNAICANSLIESNKVFKFKFDLIIGNPPYGLSRGNQIEKKELALLKDKYQSFFKAKINKYLAFVYESYLNLAKGGELLFIIPNSWLGVKSGYAIRELLLNDGSLKSIYVYKQSVFRNANVETVTLHIKKMANLSKVKIVNKTVPLSEESHSFFSYDDWRNNQDYMIPTRWSNLATDVFSVLDKNTKPIKFFNSLFSSKIALQVYATKKGVPPQTKEMVKNHSFHSNSRVNKNYFPYLEGRDIGRFKIEEEKSYLNYGKHIAEFQSIDRYNSKRIVLREIIGGNPYCFRASIISKTAFYNKSCLHINLKDKSREGHLYALCTILNSKLGSFILQFRGRKSQRKIFPKIVNDDLLNFPYPDLSDEDLREFKSLYLAIEKKVDDISLNESLDEKVYSVYKLSKFKKEIENELNEAY